jgi:translation initiation factor IF-2
MLDKGTIRLNKLVKEFNVSIDRIFAFLEPKGIKDLKPNSKVSHDVYMDLLGEFDSEKKAKL